MSDGLVVLLGVLGFFVFVFAVAWKIGAWEELGVDEEPSAMEKNCGRSD